MSDRPKAIPPDLARPEVDALASAILDGVAIDWRAAAEKINPAYVDEFRVVEALSLVHGRAGALSESALTGAPDPGPPDAFGAWGRFALVDVIGEGSFGTVYRAWDPQLQRFVALKLAPNSVQSSSAPAEARLLARVQHPHVLTVYDAEAIDGQVGIWTEFIDGRTLDAIVRDGGPLPADDVLAIGITLCGAFAAVHAANLLHRDVKAQNVMRETTGRIVLMDFGASHDLRQPARAGDLTGTPLYLAPEVIAGGKASVASDVYSLSVLLFYLLTGRHPVSGHTFREVQAAHRRRDRERGLIDEPRVPAILAAVIERGLADDPTSRHQSARNLEDALREAQATIAGERHGFSPWWPRLRAWVFATNGRMLLAVTTVVLAVGLAAFVVSQLVTEIRRNPTPLPRVNVRRVTFTQDNSQSAMSPDGSFVALVRRDNDVLSAWRHEIATDHEAQLALPPGPLKIRSLSVEPGDRYVDLTVDGKGRSDNTVWRLPMDGGAPSVFVRNAEGGVGWSPDGRHIAFVQMSGGQDGDPASLVIADAKGTLEHRLPPHVPPGSYSTFGTRGLSSSHPAWSPDGRTIAAIAAGRKSGIPNEIHVLDSVSGRLMQMIQVDGMVSEIAWIDRNTLAVIRGRSDHMQAWTLDLRTRDLEVLTTDISSFNSVSAAADGRTLALTRTDPIVGGVWLGDASGSGVETIVPETTETPFDIGLDASGDLIFDAQADDRNSIWFRPSSGAPARRIAPAGSEPRLSPDGRFVVYLGSCGERSGICRVQPDGASPVLLSPRGQWATISLDSKTVFFMSPMSERPCRESPQPVHCGQTLWSVPLAGGTARQVSDWYLTNFPVISADGRRMAFLVRDSDPEATRLALTCDMPDCTDIREHRLALLQRPIGTWGITPDGTSLAYVSSDRPANIWIEPFDGSAPPRQLTQFADHRSIRRFAWSPDGQHLALARILTTSDIVTLRLR